ncbi:MAG: hypothetical protein AAFP84_07895 [Actinomycetota bacterium]
MSSNEVLIVVVFGGGLVVGTAALVHIWTTPTDSWRRTRLGVLGRVLWTVFLLPVFGLITVGVAVAYWLIVGRRVRREGR